MIAAITGSQLLSPPDSSAHWAGFTGDLWYCKRENNESTFEGQNSDYWVLPPGVYCSTIARHSYGFNSATNVSASTEGAVCARVTDPAGNQRYGNCGWNYTRSCYEGVYPNCHDQDGYSWTAWVRNADGVNLRMKGHGAY